MNAQVARFRHRRGVVALAIGVGTVALGAHSAAAAAPGSAYVIADVQCDTGSGDGVVDVTLVNDDAQAGAVFVVAGGAPIEVAPLSASALTYTGVGDGTFSLAVTVDGVDASVNLSVSCGNRVEVRPSPRAGQVSSLPVTGSATSWGLAIGAGLVATGMAATRASRRRFS